MSRMLKREMYLYNVMNNIIINFVNTFLTLGGCL